MVDRELMVVSFEDRGGAWQAYRARDPTHGLLLAVGRGIQVGVSTGVSMIVGSERIPAIPPDEKKKPGHVWAGLSRFIFGLKGWCSTA